MSIVNYILLVLIFCLVPAGVLWLCRKIEVLGKIGPILLLYLLGIVIGNLGIMPEEMPVVQEILSSAMVPLAIPLMLFGCTFRKNIGRNELLALLTGVIAVAVAVVGGYYLFGRSIENGDKIGGMLTGVYTGGTINLAALKTMLGVGEQTYVLLNTYDMVVSFLYMTFLLAAGIRLFRRFLPYKSTFARSGVSRKDDIEIIESGMANNGSSYKGLFSKTGLKDICILLGMTLLICALSAGIALCLEKWIPFITIFILLLTTLSIGGSFIKSIHNLKYGYDVGMYFIYIFSIVVASMADLSNLALSSNLNLVGYLMFVVFMSLFIQVLLAKIFKIDADTVVVSSVSFINSPPFVPMISAAMKNKNVLVTGLSIGIIGYAIGNYLGFFMAGLLELL